MRAVLRGWPEFGKEQKLDDLLLILSIQNPTTDDLLVVDSSTTLRNETAANHPELVKRVKFIDQISLSDFLLALEIQLGHLRQISKGHSCLGANRSAGMGPELQS